MSLVVGIGLPTNKFAMERSSEAASKRPLLEDDAQDVVLAWPSKGLVRGHQNLIGCSYGRHSTIAC